jgi:hypothetical protein
MLEVLLHRNVVDAIRALNNSSDEPFWHLATTTKDRVDILLARLQRQFHSSVACCVEGRRATGALFYFLQSDFALDLRSDIAKQIRARSRAHSSDWHRMNGVWLVVKHALRTIVQEFEQSAEEEPVPESTTHRLRDWFNKYLMLGKRADRRN